jgi:hypothetical protein
METKESVSLTVGLVGPEGRCRERERLEQPCIFSVARPDMRCQVVSFTTVICLIVANNGFAERSIKSPLVEGTTVSHAQRMQPR